MPERPRNNAGAPRMQAVPARPAVTSNDYAPVLLPLRMEQQGSPSMGPHAYPPHPQSQAPSQRHQNGKNNQHAPHVQHSQYHGQNQSYAGSWSAGPQHQHGKGQPQKGGWKVVKEHVQKGNMKGDMKGGKGTP